MDYYATISNVVSNNSQFLLLLVVTYCVLKIIHLEKRVKYLRYDFLCLKDEVMNQQLEEQEDEDDEKTETDEENKDDEKDPDYDPEEESSDTSEEQGF